MDKLEDTNMMVSNKEKSAWSELVKKYPDKWIIYTDVDIVKDDRLFLCRVLEVCDDSARSERKLYYLTRGIKAIATRTSSNFNCSMGGNISMDKLMKAATMDNNTEADSTNLERIWYSVPTNLMKTEESELIRLSVPKSRLKGGILSVKFNYEPESGECKVISIE